MIGGIMPIKRNGEINIPRHVLSSLGLQKGSHVYFGLIKPIQRKRRRGQRSNLIISLFEPHDWGDLWKFEMAFSEDPGRIHRAVEFLGTRGVNVIVEESLTTHIEDIHEMMVIASLRDYTDTLDSDSPFRRRNPFAKLPNLLRKMKEELEDILDKDDYGNHRLSITRMDYLYCASQRRRTRGLARISNEPYKIEEKGSIRIPRAFLNEIKRETERIRNGNVTLNKAIVFSDSEEKYINFMVLSETEEIRWMDIEHSQGVGKITPITGYFYENSINILCSFNRVERIPELAHFNVFVDVTNMDIEQGNKIPAIKKDLKSLPGDVIIDLREITKYDEKTQEPKKDLVPDKDIDTPFSQMQQIYNFLMPDGDFNLMDYQVIGYCMRYDSDDLKKMLSKVDEVENLFNNSGSSYYRCLIWGPPGHGKSFFVEELIRETKKKYDHVEDFQINLLKIRNRNNFTEELNKITAALSRNTPAIVFVDEIHSKGKTDWVPALLMNCIVEARSIGTPNAWFVAGSKGEDIKELMRFIRGMGDMGPDLLRRLENKLVIPLVTREDRILVALANFKRLLETKAALKGSAIKSVEMKALSFFALGSIDHRKLDQAGDISKFAEEALSRCKVKEKIFLYEHLFSPGHRIREDFSRRKANLFEKLGNGRISLGVKRRDGS